MTDRPQKDGELKGRLEHLSTRGEPRGARYVLEAAQARATEPPPSQLRRLAPAVAVAAAVSLIAGVSGALVFDNGNSAQIATGPVGTVTTATTEAPIVEVSIPSRLISQSRLVPFANCEAYTTYVRNQGLAKVTPYGLPNTGSGGMFAGRAMADSSAAGAAESRNSGEQTTAAPPLAATDDGGFSTTNVQEAGIDEPDVVKTDGRRIFALSNGRLYVVDANALKVLGSVSVGAARDLFVSGNRALVFGGVAGGGAPGQPMPMERGVASDAMIAPYAQKLRITVVDVSDPASMREVSHMDVDGSYVSARLVGGVARVVVSSHPSRIAFTYPQGDGGREAQAAALEQNKRVIRDAKFDAWVPHYTITDAAGRPGAEQPLVNCDTAYRPPEFSGFGNLSVISLDPAKPNEAKTASVMADGQIVYASANRLYVATNQWGNVEPAGGVAPPASPKTLVHSFDITDEAQAKYLVSGTVRGTALNQFSMSEHEGRLRIATTDQGNGQNSESFVSVLAPSAEALVQVGQVGGLGKGEQIHSVRFVGPVGYVVTFRQTDPLYVVNLEDPAKPRVVGELKILGYSAYLHPVGDGLLLGVGQDATEEGRRLGSQVSLFDVSNPAAPKRLQQHSLGSQGSSQVEFDHHAFLYWAPKKLAVIPVQIYGGGGDQPVTEPGSPESAKPYSPGFMGAVGMTIDPGAIKEVGRVSNPNGMVERSMVIGDRLFTYSASGIKASSLDSFAEQGWMAFN